MHILLWIYRNIWYSVCRVATFIERAFTLRLSLTFETSQLSKIVRRQDNGECSREVYYILPWVVVSIRQVCF